MIEGFNEIFNTIYIAKKLYDLGKYDLVTANFSHSIDYDLYYSNMYELMSNIFQYYHCRYYVSKGLEFHVLSDPVVVDFYILAGRYGRLRNVPDTYNPYIEEAEQELNDSLYISHELDWKIVGYTEPRRPFHSRLGLFINYDCGCLDIGVLVYRLIEVYEWFANKCDELRNILNGVGDVSQTNLSGMGAVA